MFENVSCEIENFIHKNNEYIPINYKNLFHSLGFFEDLRKTSRFCFPDLILDNNNLINPSKLKYYIKKEQLHLLNPDVNKDLKLIQGRIYERTYFHPRRFIYLHCLKFGLIERAKFEGELFNDRQSFNYKRIND